MNTATVSRKRPASLAAQVRQAKAVLRQLKETIEDLDDHLALERAIKRNAGKPLQPWREVAKELGIPSPPKKR
jgi:hypothetical protein